MYVAPRPRFRVVNMHGDTQASFHSWPEAVSYLKDAMLVIVEAKDR